MKSVWTLIFALLVLGLAQARPANFSFVPGKSFGPVKLGASFQECIASLPGWTYNDDGSGYAIGPYFVFPREAKDQLVQFILGFTPAKVLRDVEIHDPSCSLEGHPKVRLGCSIQDVEGALGPAAPSGYPRQLDYPQLGVRFGFEDGKPPRAQDPFNVPKFRKGQCESIQIYRPE